MDFAGQSTGDKNIVKKRKKGFRNDENYSQNIIKKQRLSGSQYISSRNKVVPAKSIGEDCRCKKKCFIHVPATERLLNFQKLYGLSTKNEQDIFLQSLISCAEIERRRPRAEAANTINRFGSYRYFVETTSGRVEVCKKGFLSIFSVSDKRVRHLSSLKQVGKLPQDGRGKEIGSRRAIDGELCLKVKKHIESFNVKEIHYGNSQKNYLDAELDIKKMHAMFLEKNPDCTGKISYSFYRSYFKTNFSLSFGRPQVDVCSKCEEIKAKIKSTFLCESAKRAAVCELLVHKTKAKKFYRKIEEIQNITQTRNDVLGICIDYMQNLPLPHIPVQEIFYYRQLWVNEFCIHDLRTQKAVFYSYHEGIANKGPNEVCSFLNHYFNVFAPKEIQEVHIFSDGCAGQNKNNTMVRFLLGLTDTHRFKKIYHYFPVRGHSFLPCDRDFGLVKRKVKRFDRLYIPSEYENIIVTSSNIEYKIRVYEVDTQLIIDFKGWWSRFYKKNCLAIQSLGKKVPKEKKVNFSVSLFNQFYYDSMKPGFVQTAEFIDGMITYDFKLYAGREPVTMPVDRAYGNDQVPINYKKIEDIKKVLKHIPSKYFDFYNTIINWPTTTAETVEEDGE